MEENAYTLIAVFGLLSLAPLDAIRNDKELKERFKERIKKGTIIGFLLSFSSCLLIYLAHNSNLEKGAEAYTLTQWVVGMPVSSLIFTAIFTLLFVLRPHPERNSFGFLKIFTMIFWAGAVGFIFFCSVFLVAKLLNLLA